MSGASTLVDRDDLRRFLSVARRRGWIVLLTMVVAVAVAVGLALVRTPKYEARTTLLIRPGSTAEILSRNQTNLFDAQRHLNNELELIKSSVLREEVDKAYDGPLRPKDVEAATTSEQSDVIELSLVSSNAGEAARLVNQYATTFIDLRRRQQVDELLAVGTDVQKRLDSVRAEIATVSKPLTDLEAQLARATGAEAASLQRRRDALESELSSRLGSLRNQESFYRQQLDEVRLTEHLTRSGVAQVATPATVPTDPVSPRPLREAGIAAGLGWLLGVGLAFLRERLDESIRTGEDLEDLTGLPTLGLIPRINTRGGGKRAELVIMSDPSSAAAEAFRSLRTSLRFVDEKVSVIQVTSPAASEGKTLIAANLAAAGAAAGEEVAIVSTDLRRPRLQNLFGVPVRPGLTNVLLGEASVSDVLVPVDKAKRLYLMPSGDGAANPSELLGSSRAHKAIDSLADYVDLVVLDSPPVLPVSDALAAGTLADATVLVVAAGSTTRRAVLRTLELLRQVGAPVVGTVFNLADESAAYGQYAYRYPSKDAENGAKDRGKNGWTKRSGRAGRRVQQAGTRK